MHVTLVSNGGAFGGKEDLSIQGQVALMAVLTGRPVKATLTREESIRLHPKRHPMTLHLHRGLRRGRAPHAVRARIVGDKGAFASVGTKVLERAAGHAAGPYKVPAVDIEALAVYTNNLPCGAMRGFGANQAAFAIEGMLDILAERVGIDGWEIRWRNALDVGDTFCTGQVLEHAVGLKQTLLAVKDAYYGVAACRHRLRHQERRHRQRHARSRTGRRRDRSRTAGSSSTAASPRWARGSTRPWSSACATSPASTRDVRAHVRSTPSTTPCGMTTASRATVLGGRAVAGRRRAAAARTSPAA